MELIEKIKEGQINSIYSLVKYFQKQSLLQMNHLAQQKKKQESMQSHLGKRNLGNKGSKKLVSHNENNEREGEGYKTV